MHDTLGFRAVSEADIPLLHDWLNRAHLRRFYQKEPISLAAVADEYGPAIRGEEPSHLHLALLGDRPFGYLQCYRNLDYPDYAREIGLQDGASIDLYMGEQSLLGQGWGKRMERAYVLERVFPLYPREQHCYVLHERGNAAALACSLAAGFQPLRDVVEAGQPSHLLIFRRP